MDHRQEGEMAGKPQRQALLLLAKSAFAATPHREMSRIAAALAARPEIRARFDLVECCYLEQGEPSLRDALRSLAEKGLAQVVILPVIVPMEPSLRNWLGLMLALWRAESPLPDIVLADEIAATAGLSDILARLALEAPRHALPCGDAPRPEAVQVPSQHYRVLVCTGPTCHARGATAIWAHLRNQQVRRKLRVTGAGTMTAKTSCLGPCALGPVVQVFPDGTWYGGVTEEALDRMIDEHLLAGHPVADFAYSPGGRKQQLRALPLSPEKKEHE
ncbi:(2Fe-2S) ferredoxin domain-containing protein [Paracoccus aminophilus]|uniref:(2Fe-2S) ferredoxin domain-containing protein n=1 Tax=Paracoccus aminophilus TaxID=34003 RepID=UPI000410805B|nr:(2Fe-2S) ferredoxin domain-containing protein [Paracoccus aminophilus]